MSSRDDLVKRAPVKCPACGGRNIVAGESSGFACDDCGKKARLRDFRQGAAKPLDAPLTQEEEVDMAKFLGKFAKGKA